MPRIARTKKDLVAALGEPRSTVYRLAAHPECPRRSDGAWDVEQVRAWMEDRRVARAERAAAARHETEPAAPAPREPAEQVDDPSEEGPRWADVRTRKAMVETQRALFDLKVRRGEFVPREEVANLLATRMATFRRRLQSAARIIGRQCGEQLGADPKGVEDIAIDHLLDILREVYGKVPSDLVVA